MSAITSFNLLFRVYPDLDTGVLLTSPGNIRTLPCYACAWCSSSKYFQVIGCDRNVFAF